MSTRILALALIAVAGIVSASEQHVLQVGDAAAFVNFLEKYGKQYEDPAEYTMRLDTFLSNKIYVEMHNKKGESFERELNEYADWTPAEKQALFGFNSRMHAAKKAAPRPVSFKTHVATNRTIKSSVDWASSLSHTVPNQEFCGSCWAFAGVACLEGRVKQATGHNVALSVQEAVSCTPNKHHCGGTGGCDGATIELMYDYVIENGGIAAQSDYPYTSGYGSSGTCKNTKHDKVVKISGYVDIASNDYNALIDAVQDGPVAISVDASGWESYGSGIFDPKYCGTTINHAVTLVGYGEENGKKFWKIRNSWGPHWGENGYIRLLRHDDGNVPCGQDVHPEEGTGCDGGPSEVTVCGSCGILYANTYPTGVEVVSA
jgi:cathepsin L